MRDIWARAGIALVQSIFIVSASHLWIPHLASEQRMRVHGFVQHRRIKVRQYGTMAGSWLVLVKCNGDLPDFDRAGIISVWERRGEKKTYRRGGAGRPMVGGAAAIATRD